MSGKKRVFVYSEYWSSRGGGEKYLLGIIETLLRANFDVTIAAQTASFDKDAVARYFKVDIAGASVERIDGSLNVFRSRAEAMSRRFDVCIYITNYRYFNSAARQTFAILQIPYGPITPISLLRKVGSNPKEAAKDFYRLKLLKHLRETHAVLVYSEFVRDTIDVIHDVPSTVLPPAIDDFESPDAIKERVILSVGRVFRGLYNDKRYDKLIEAFKLLTEKQPHNTWLYKIVGSCGSDEASQEYLHELRKSAEGFPIYFHLNSPYEELRQLYNEAMLFWHAAGFGVDERLEPQRAEHFGMSTLEAMSARAVPIVINRGGQKEIVLDGESGYLCDTMDEMVERSITLMHDEALLKSMQAKARERYKDFDREHFSNRLLSIIEP